MAIGSKMKNYARRRDARAELRRNPVPLTPQQKADRQRHKAVKQRQKNDMDNFHRNL